jgi:hypothetical protein
VKKNQDRLKDTIISVNQKIRDDKREEIFIIQLLYLRTHADDNLKDSIKRLKDTSLSIYLSTMYLSIYHLSVHCKKPTFFIGVLGGGTLCHLHRFLQCIKYIIHEFISPAILLHPLIPGVASGGIIFAFT